MRAIWKGHISFALVTIPISLFSATKRNELSFHYLHKKDMSPVSYKRFCDTEDTEVPWDEITKGYEYEKGQYIEITDEDIERADVELTKTIQIMAGCLTCSSKNLWKFLLSLRTSEWGCRICWRRSWVSE